jgi:diguanylate cyclase (GGDEF)-like protein
VFVYLLLVASVNVGLGFLAAVYLGRRYHAVLAGDGLGALLPPELADLAGMAPTAAAPYAPSPAELAINGFHDQVNEYDAQLVYTDDRVRQAGTDPTALTTCRDDLLSATKQFSQQRPAAYDRFAAAAPEGDTWDDIHNDLRTAMQLQDAEMAIAEQSLTGLDLQGDPSGGQRQMTGQINRLMHVNHHLRDTVQQAQARAAGENGHPVPPVKADAAGLLGRTGLEADLAAWWAKDPQRIHQLCVALLDMDYFGQLNEQHGSRVGNELLQAIGKLLEAQCRGENTVARFAGQQFACLFPDSNVRYVLNAVERIRQTIEHTLFLSHETEIRVTISCAVTEALPEDTQETLFARVQAALQEAKRYGRNRTFVFEGKYPSPVVPPTFALEETRVTLGEQ